MTQQIDHGADARLALEPVVMRYFAVELREAKEPAGIASASCRGCMCCNRVLSGMGGPGLFLCADCLRRMEMGDVAIALGDADRERERERSDA